MGRIDDALLQLEAIEDTSERALQIAGLVSTLFKIKGVVLIVTGRLAFDIYANVAADKPVVDLAPFTGKITTRLLLEIMRGQLHAKGTFDQWNVAGIPVRFHPEPVIAYRELCRDFNTDLGIAKLPPAEEITADRILAAVYPEPDEEAQTQARLLLINGLSEAFQMDWATLQNLCHHNDYRVGEELAKMRQSAKKDVDAIGATPNPLAQPEP